MVVGLADNAVFPGTGGATLPSGTSAQRLGSFGAIRYNTSLQQFEGYGDTGWNQFSVTGGVTSFNAGTTGLTPSIVATGAITLGGTLNVANGGTGAVTLTGYVKGAGTSAFTAVSTIPNTDITGLGSMSTQSASSVAITGGSINGTTIGAISTAAGTFTSVSASSGTLGSISLTSGTITTTPSTGNDIVNKTYVDGISAGINFHESCRLATATALPANTYNNGASGVGATLTGNANGALSVDGTLTVAGNRILAKNEVTGANNGVYIVTQVGSAGSPYVLTRATDFDTAGTGVNQINAGDFFLITAGATNANTSWVQQTPLPITVGTTAIVFQQFGAPITYSPGTGLTESPSYTFNIANTGVTANTYGSASSVPQIGVNAQGQITSASSVAIAIANTAVSGLGTMSTQNANNVAITGGTIDGTVIGGTAPAAGSFTTVTATSGIFGGAF